MKLQNNLAYGKPNLALADYIISLPLSKADLERYSVPGRRNNQVMNRKLAQSLGSLVSFLSKQCDQIHPSDVRPLTTCSVWTVTSPSGVHDPQSAYPQSGPYLALANLGTDFRPDPSPRQLLVGPGPGRGKIVRKTSLRTGLPRHSRKKYIFLVQLSSDIRAIIT
ncbi:hypothetical protein J6590_015835 [Homalodisca vitripennis]|nr:hypothetical protein J6590_015835 [Homalodisca vitripennis]